jgi:hypothetical protein
MTRAEALAALREACARVQHPRHPPARPVEPLPTDVIVRDPGSDEWARREKWITGNGGMPLPGDGPDALRGRAHGVLA